MMGKLIPVLLALLGLGAGVGAGFFLRHEPANPSVEEPGEPEPVADYVKLNNQFIVPLVLDGRVDGLVILSLSLEISPGATETVFLREPKLRDVFLQVLFDHANAGGFRGSFTDGSNLILLRRALLEVAQRTLGDLVSDVLIVDIMRQDS